MAVQALPAGPSALWHSPTSLWAPQLSETANVFEADFVPSPLWPFPQRFLVLFTGRWHPETKLELLDRLLAIGLSLLLSRTRAGERVTYKIPELVLIPPVQIRYHEVPFLLLSQGQAWLPTNQYPLSRNIRLLIYSFCLAISPCPLCPSHLSSTLRQTPSEKILLLSFPPSGDCRYRNVRGSQGSSSGTWVQLGVQIRICTDSEPLVFKQKNPHLLHSCPAPRTIPWRKSLLKALPGENHLGPSSPLKHMRFAGRGAEPRAVATGFSGNTDGQSGQRERLCEEMGRGCVEAGDSAWSPDRACRCVWPRRRSRLCAHRGELWRTKPWK